MHKFQLIQGGRDRVPSITEKPVGSKKIHYIQYDPAESERLFEKALGMSDSGDKNGAFVVYKEALKRDPDNARAHANIGQIYSSREEYENALFHYAEALRASPQYPLVYFNIGCVFEKMKKTVKAEEAYRRACKIDPLYMDAYYNLGVLLSKKGSVQEAIECLEKCVPYFKYVSDPFTESAEHLLLRLRTNQGFSTKKAPL